CTFDRDECQFSLVGEAEDHHEPFLAAPIVAGVSRNERKAENLGIKTVRQFNFKNRKGDVIEKQISSCHGEPPTCQMSNVACPMSNGFVDILAGTNDSVCRSQLGPDEIVETIGAGGMGLSGADGVVAHAEMFCERRSRRLYQRRLCGIFLMSRPPLLTRR